MGKIQSQITKKEVYEFPEYSKEELKEFANELEGYKITKNIQGKDYTFYDDKKYMIDVGALSKDGSVIITGYCTKDNGKGEKYSSCDYPTKYEIIKDKFEKLYKLQGKREYAQKMNTKDLVESIHVDNETQIDEF